MCGCFFPKRYNYAFLFFLFSDNIALPDFSAGAMENWGLVTYRESVMLYDPEANNKFQRSYTAMVVSHELAHMVRQKSKVEFCEKAHIH